MTTSVGIAETNVSASQMSEFFRLAALSGSHVNRATVQAFLERRNPFGEPALESEFHLLSINYTQSLEQMIAAGCYDWTNDEITPERFPIEGNGIVECEARYFKFDRDISSEDAVKKIEAAGWTPAKIEHLLSFGVSYPEEQRKFPIIALGSVAEVGDRRRVPCLYEVGSERYLRLSWWDVDWLRFYRFLAVRKVSES